VGVKRILGQGTFGFGSGGSPWSGARSSIRRRRCA